MWRPPRVLLVILIAAVALSGLALILLNPFDWFLDRSERFTVDGFLAIEPGMEITDVVERLGEPIRTSTLGELHRCKGCRAYFFLGNPPGWLIMYREAWVIVDTDGTVVQRVLLEEP